LWAGPGLIAAAGACALLGIKRPLLVTDRAWAMRLWCCRARELVRERLGLRASCNPVAANIEAVSLPTARRPRGVIRLASARADSRQVIAFISVQTRPLWDFETWMIGGHAGATGGHRKPIVALPTTSCTAGGGPPVVARQ